FLVIKRHQRIATLAVAFDGGTIHDDQVRATIIVTIEKAETAAHGFNYVTFIGSGDVGGRDAKFSRDILKLGHRHGTGRLLLPCGGRRRCFADYWPRRWRILGVQQRRADESSENPKDDRGHVHVETILERGLGP